MLPESVIRNGTAGTPMFDGSGLPAAPLRIAIMAAYYLDDRLSTAERERRYTNDGIGREIRELGFYALAIRKKSCSGWVFRFPPRDTSAPLILAALNRQAEAR
jgi:hypothetical protein